MDNGQRRGRLAGVAAVLVVMALLVMGPGAVRATPARQAIPDTYDLAAENDRFELYVDSHTLAFKVRDRRSDYVWHSGIDAPIDGDRLNRSWQAFALSGLSIEVYDQKAVKTRESMLNVEHEIAVTPIEQGVSAQVVFAEHGITVVVQLQLEDDGVRVEVPGAALREDNPGFRLGQVYVYPFMGATRGGSTPGYMLLPDGTGSLIDFADDTRARNMFYGRVYGPDLGMLGIEPYNPRVRQPFPISYPVFGMVHGEGEHAFLSVVERGAAYAELQAHPAGIITNFNFLYYTFIYNQSYFQATNRSGAGISTVQQQRNDFDAVVHYRFLTGADANYMGLARDFQRYLLERNELAQNEFDNPDIGIRLEFLGGDKEPVLLANRFVPMTTLAQMDDILASLALPNPEVIYYGWQPYGATSVPPTTLQIDGGLGSVDELGRMADDIAAQGGHFSLYYNPQAALYNEPGYSARNDLAMAITDTSLEGYNRYPTYFFTFHILEERLASLTADIAARNPNIGLALAGMGSTVYSDYRSGRQLGRQAAIEAYRAVLAQAPVPLSFYQPNDYVYFLARAYYDMPLGDNGYIYTTRTVPFLPAVLCGYIPAYGGALNFSSDWRRDLLRHAEYGIYPSYFLTSAPTDTMINTPSVFEIYSSAYDQWGAQVQETYAWLNALLAPVRGQPMVAHEQLANDVYATTYANGMQIIVNYRDSEYVRGALTVNARDAALVEVNS
jgi:hypothetical protein